MLSAVDVKLTAGDHGEAKTWALLGIQSVQIHSIALYKRSERQIMLLGHRMVYRDIVINIHFFDSDLGELLCLNR